MKSVDVIPLNPVGKDSGTAPKRRLTAIATVLAMTTSFVQAETDRTDIEFDNDVELIFDETNQEVFVDGLDDASSACYTLDGSFPSWDGGACDGGSTEKLANHRLGGIIPLSCDDETEEEVIKEVIVLFDSEEEDELYTASEEFYLECGELEDDEDEDDEDGGDEDDEGEGDEEDEEDGDNENDEDSETETNPDPGSGSGSDSGSGQGHGHTNHCMMTPDFAELNLVTHTATQSGRWTDSATWGGSAPVNGSIVLIPEGIEVTVASLVNTRLETVRIDGTLAFSNSQNSELQVDTLYSSCPGHLQIGTESAPISTNVSAKITFIDDGPVSDAKRLSRGAILKGKTTMHGAPRTHRVAITPHAKQGDTVLQLNAAPTGWQVDDELIITGTVPNDPLSDEIRKIRQVNGNQVVLDSPLNLDHSAPRPDLNVYVANATRNIEFISENPSVEHRGHIMFMSHDVNVQNARFTELGRTDKTRQLDDFQFAFDDGGAGDDAPATAEVTALGGSNVRGRYPIHFHQVGVDAMTTPALVKGSVVFNGPGWGFVNHSSNVDFIDNVSYGLQGAGFYTEAGNEIGSMQGNIAIRSVNGAFRLDDQGAIDPDLGADFMDYGRDGDGFWLTGNRVKMINNVASGASAHGIIYWTDGIMEPAEDRATRVTVAVKDLPNGNLIPNRETIPVWWAPMAESRGNESYGSTVGFRIRYIHAKNYLGREDQSGFHRSPPQAYIETLNPTIHDLTVWGNRDGVLLNYNERMSLNGARIIGFGKESSQFSFNPGTAKSGIGFDIGNDATHGPGRVNNVTIEGFGMGFATPVNGSWEIENMSLINNNVDMLVQEPEPGPAEVILRNVGFSTFQINDEEEAEQLPPHITVEN